MVEWGVNQSFKDHLHPRHQVTVDDEDAGGLIAIQPPDAASSPRVFDWIFESRVENISGEAEGWEPQ